MAKAPQRKATKKEVKSPSGLSGGPGNIRGVNYQLDHAVSLLLDQITQALADPLTQGSITVEPRTLDPHLGRWDIRTEPPDTTFEAKYNPKREELFDWLVSVEKSWVGTPERRFRFVYAEERSAASVLHAVKGLRRIAIEANGDRKAFEDLVTREEIKDANEVLAILGTEPHRLLQQIDFEQISDSALMGSIQLRLRYLSSPEESERLRTYLFEKLQRAAPLRVSLRVEEAITELRASGFTLIPPHRLDARVLSAAAFAALSVLEIVKCPLPLKIIAAVAGATEESLATELARIRGISFTGSLCLLAPLGVPVAHPNEEALRGRALEELLSYIRSEGKSLLAQDQIANVITLGEDCRLSHSRLVARVFGELDKLLKETGKKHLVRDAAMLSKSAAEQNPTDPDMKLAIIRSLICGFTWYYQRVGDLEQANAAAAKSLRFATEVDSHIDLAFSAKCTGRLRRLEAESATTPQERQSKLSESLGMLLTAIQTFTNAEGYGERSADVGDCYSLMARTYLVQGDRRAARENLGRALQRLPDNGGKDQLDALILGGDIEIADKNPEEAFGYYDQAIAKAQSNGRDVTEMRARALRQRGRAKKSVGKTAAAEADFKESARIWAELGEPNPSAEAEFELLSLSVEIPVNAQSLILNEPAAVRVKVLKFHADEVARHNEKSGKAVGRRKEPQSEYWKDLIRRAHADVAFEVS